MVVQSAIQLEEENHICHICSSCRPLSRDTDATYLIFISYRSYVEMVTSLHDLKHGKS